MKKLLLLFPVCLISCKTYTYEVAIEKCNGKTDTIKVQSAVDPYIANYKRAVPELYITTGANIINVCDFKIIKKY